MRNKILKSKILLIIIPLLFIPLLGISGSAATDEELAQQYAPILYFEGQETCYPVDISYHVDNSNLYQLNEDTAIVESPTIEDLAQYSTSEYFYLDNQQGSINDNGIINDYKSKKNAYESIVYVNVDNSGVKTVIQYWFFYAFNKGELNKHEGDWEMVQVVISGGKPSGAMYSQHHSGQRATWDQVEKEGNHIKVYVARGSHANYLRSYSGKLGIASDIVGDNGNVLRVDKDYSLELINPTDNEWLNYAGRWGEFNNIADEALGRVGPHGPMYREGGAMWKDPIRWGNSLLQADGNLFLGEWFVYNFFTIFILLTLVSLCIIGFKIYQRHKKHGLGPRIVSILYIDKFDLKSIGNILCIIGIIIAIFGLFSPWYSISYGVDVAGFETGGMVDLISIDGIDGIQISIPGESGPTPMATFVLPFSLLIGIGLVFLILASIGIAHSNKLGKKYIWRGFKLLVPIIVILIFIMFLGSVAAEMAKNMTGSYDVGSVFNSLSGSPLGGQESINIMQSGVSGRLDLQWGLGSGGMALLFAGIILFIAGILEIIGKTEFFKPKTVDISKKEKKKKSKKQTKDKQPETPKVEEPEQPDKK